MKTGIAGHFSTTSQTELIGKMTENANNKIPEYAREYKREYQFIRGINKEFKYLNDFENNCNNFKSHKLDRIMKFIKRFLLAQEKGRLKDISKLELNYDDVDNIIDLIKNLPEYFYFIQNHYDWSRDDDESLISRYEIYKDDLELFLSKLNIEIEYSDSDSDSDSDIDTDIILPDFDDDDISFSYSDSDSDSDSEDDF